MTRKKLIHAVNLDVLHDMVFPRSSKTGEVYSVTTGHDPLCVSVENNFGCRTDAALVERIISRLKLISNYQFKDPLDVESFSGKANLYKDYIVYQKSVYRHLKSVVERETTKDLKSQTKQDADPVWEFFQKKHAGVSEVEYTKFNFFLERGIDLNTEVNDIVEKKGTLLYFPPNDQMIKAVDTQIPLNQLKYVEGHPTAIAFQYPNKVGIDRIIESMVKETEKQISDGKIQKPVTVFGMSIGGMVCAEVAKKLIDNGFSINRVHVHNTSRSLSNLVSEWTCIPRNLASAIVKHGLGQDLDTTLCLEEIEKSGTAVRITATENDWLMQGLASFSDDPRGLIHEKRRLAIGCCAPIILPLAMIGLADRLSTRVLKNEDNKYSFGGGMLEYRENDTLQNSAVNTLKFTGRTFLKSLALPFTFTAGMALVASEVYTGRKTVKKKTQKSAPSDDTILGQSKELHVDKPILRVDVLPALHYKKETLNHTAFYHQTVMEELKKLHKVGKIKSIKSVEVALTLRSNPVKK
tara:strand:- start:325 stop:1890 length:1566 start_codon:yes stop_codon:yes gene_type:complete